MANNKYVACLSCGMVYDTEENDYIIDAPLGHACCNCTFHKTDNGDVWCKVHKEEKEEEELRKELEEEKEEKERFEKFLKERDRKLGR